MRQAFYSPYDAVEFVLLQSTDPAVWSISPRQLLPLERFSRFVLGSASESTSKSPLQAQCNANEDASASTGSEIAAPDTSTFSISTEESVNDQVPAILQSDDVGPVGLNEIVLQEDHVACVIQYGKCLRVSRIMLQY